MTLTPGCDYGKLGKTVRIKSFKRVDNEALLTETALVNRFVHLVDIATDDQKEDGLSEWKDGYMYSTRSAKDRSIIAMASSVKNLELTKDGFSQEVGLRIEICKE